MTTQETSAVRTISVVIPVYKGASTLEPLLAEIEPLTLQTSTPRGVLFRVVETILVDDGATDGSDAVISSSAERLEFVRAVWLSRNYGQHAATLAGIASSTGDWVVTLDEDGEHDPQDIARLLDTAVDTDSQLVYASPANAPSHGRLRNSFSAMTKWIFKNVLGHAHMGEFHSFRLIEGEIARGLAAYCGHGIYLDVALSWIVAWAASCPVVLRASRGRPSSYSFNRLTRHFWHLVLTSGTIPLRLVALLGIASIILGILLSTYVAWRKLSGSLAVPGWASLLIMLSLFSGLILFSLGILAEYMAVTVQMALGKPLYMITSRPSRSRPRKP
jgi:glycosyltransferase involved in cell wall biosynthesis